MENSSAEKTASGTKLQKVCFEEYLKNKIWQGRNIIFILGVFLEIFLHRKYKGAHLISLRQICPGIDPT